MHCNLHFHKVNIFFGWKQVLSFPHWAQKFYLCLSWYFKLFPYPEHPPQLKLKKKEILWSVRHFYFISLALFFCYVKLCNCRFPYYFSINSVSLSHNCCLINQLSDMLFCFVVGFVLLDNIHGYAVKRILSSVNWLQML